MPHHATTLHTSTIDDEPMGGTTMDYYIALLCTSMSLLWGALTTTTPIKAPWHYYTQKPIQHSTFETADHTNHGPVILLLHPAQLDSTDTYQKLSHPPL